MVALGTRLVATMGVVFLSLTPTYAVIPPPILDSLRAGGRTLGGPGGCEDDFCGIYSMVLAGTGVDACVTVRNIADSGQGRCKVIIASGSQETERIVAPGKTRTFCADLVEVINLKSFDRELCRAIWRVDMK